ncbi:MAG: hypothetical protein MJZ38_00325 [archaeon]|nr:hypothetical protein [archaeon]
MTDMTMNNNGNRKKYLVPLVVLLLCGVALTGAAYAYSSTLNTTGTINQGDDAILIHFNDSEETATAVSTIVFTVNYDVDSNVVDMAGNATYTAKLEEVAPITKYVNITNVGTTTLAGPVKLKAVVSDNGPYTITMKIGENEITSDAGANAVIGSNTITITVSVTDPEALEEMTADEYATWKTGLGTAVSFKVAFTATEITA